MAKGDRVLDPDSIRDFQQYLQAQVDLLDDDIIPAMKTGVLSNAPAFGRLQASNNARTVYDEFFGNTWDNMQKIRGVYCAMLKQLEGALDAHNESETANTSDTTNIDDQITQ